MDEEQLRLEYWEDNRTNRDFPLWVIFKYIGHAAKEWDGVPYLRHAQRDVPSILKSLETHPSLAALAADLSVAPEELRAALWYCTWVVEHLYAKPEGEEWNARVDDAWRNQILRITEQRS